ncbi:MAG: futalosine hydrolase [Jatrophihabitans sp.]|nr:MAG: futalosine hydrolase [Jatrophihabitans sp.]
MSPVLVVTAVEAERAAVLAAAPGAHVVVAGVGPAAAAAGTAAALAAGGWDLVVCAGIAGGFAPLGFGDVAVADAIVFADLGVEHPGGFAPISSTGFGTERYGVDPALAADLAGRCGASVGAVLTVATVTATAATAARLAGRFPGAVAEAMEGAGVAAAAARFGVPVAEVRTVSNPVGPRDRAAWQVSRALEALGAAMAKVIG